MTDTKKTVIFVTTLRTNACPSLLPCTVIFFLKTFSSMVTYRKYMFDWQSTHQHVMHILIEDHHNFTWRPSTGLYCGMLVVVTSNMIQRLMVCTAQSFVWFFYFHLLTLHFTTGIFNVYFIWKLVSIVTWTLYMYNAV